MARNQETVTVPRDVWTELTNADATEITFFVRRNAVEVRVGTSTPPSDSLDGFGYSVGQGALQIALTGLAYGGGTRVWAKGIGEAEVLVDHP